MLAAHEAGDRVATLEPVADAAEVLAAQDAATRVRASEALRYYIVALLARTRADPRVELGASPRAGLLLLRAAKARALLAGRDHALPDDVQQMVERRARAPHRAGARGATTSSGEQVVADAVGGDARPLYAPRCDRRSPPACSALALARRGGAVRRRAAVGAGRRARACSPRAAPRGSRSRRAA